MTYLTTKSIRKQANEIIITQVKTRGRSETYTMHAQIKQIVQQKICL